MVFPRRLPRQDTDKTQNRLVWGGPQVQFLCCSMHDTRRSVTSTRAVDGEGGVKGAALGVVRSPVSLCRLCGAFCRQNMLDEASAAGDATADLLDERLEALLSQRPRRSIGV